MPPEPYLSRKRKLVNDITSYKTDEEPFKNHLKVLPMQDPYLQSEDYYSGQAADRVPKWMAQRRRQAANRYFTLKLILLYYLVATLSAK